MKVHHIGYLVKNITNSIETFQKLGYKIHDKIIYDQIRGINICFMLNGETCVELISSVDNKSICNGLYKKIGNSPYHICYKADSYEVDLVNLQNEGYFLIDEPQIAPALDNKKVAFLFHNEIGLIEVLE